MRRDLMDRLLAARPDYHHETLSKAKAADLLHRSLGLVFPHFSSGPSTRTGLLAIAEHVEANLRELLSAVGIEDLRAGQVIEHYFEAVEGVAAALQQDAAFIVSGDPAARSLDEVVLAYPGFFAIAAYRIAHVLYLQRVPILPRLITEHAH